MESTKKRPATRGLPNVDLLPASVLTDAEHNNICLQEIYGPGSATSLLPVIDKLARLYMDATNPPKES